MSIRTTSFIPGEYYHIYNRGVDKRDIFLDQHDYLRFIALLYVCNSTNKVHTQNHFNKGKTFTEAFEVERNETLVDIVAYCLMPNHFHLLVREKQEGGATEFMRKLSTAYAMYFNKRYERTGSLFEGKFKAKHVDTEAYFMWLFSYIHLNPVKLIEPEWKEVGILDIEKVKEFLKSYKYSSYQDYFMGDRLETVILNKTATPEFMRGIDAVEDLAQQFNNAREIFT